MNDLRRYTEVERSQHINQTDRRVYGESYVANTSSVDGRSAFLNEPAQHDRVDYFQSFARLLEKGPPSKLPTHREDAIRRDSQLLESETNVHRLKRRNASASQIKAAESKARGYRASLTKNSLQQYKFERVRQRRWIEDLPTALRPHLHQGRPRPPTLRRLLMMIHRIYKS